MRLFNPFFDGFPILPGKAESLLGSLLPTNNPTDRRFLTLNLFYIDDCPSNYQPPYFSEANDPVLKFPYAEGYEAKTFRMGTVHSGHHATSLAATLLTTGDTAPAFSFYSRAKQLPQDALFKVERPIDSDIRKNDDILNTAIERSLSIDSVGAPTAAASKGDRDRPLHEQPSKGPSKPEQSTTPDVLRPSSNAHTLRESQVSTQTRQDLMMRSKLRQMVEPSQHDSVEPTQRIGQGKENPPTAGEELHDVVGSMPQIRFSEAKLRELDGVRILTGPGGNADDPELDSEDVVVECQCGFDEDIGVMVKRNQTQ